MKWLYPVIWRRHPWLRWIVRLIGLLVVAATAAHPWIIDGILRQYLQSHGLRIETSEVSYQGSTWSGLSWSGSSLEVRVESVDAPSLAALAGCCGSRDALIDIQDMVVEWEPDRHSATPSGEPMGLAEVASSLLEFLPPLERLLPLVKVSGIRVIVSGEETAAIQEVRWVTGQLVIHEASWPGELPEEWLEKVDIPELSELRIARQGTNALQLSAEFTQSTSLVARLESKMANQAQLQFQLAWNGGDLEAKADCGDGEWLPKEINVSARGNSFPGQKKNPLASLDPSFSVEAGYSSRTNTFSIDLDGSGRIQPEETGSRPVPWTLSVEAAGNPEEILVTGLNLDLPGLQANLDKELNLDRRTWMPADAVSLRWSIDLARMSLPDWSGSAEGVLYLKPAEDKTGSEFSANGSVRQLAIAGSLWPETISSLDFSTTGLLDAMGIRAESMEIQAADLGRATGQLTWDWNFGLVDSVILEGVILPRFLERWISADQLKLPEDGMGFSVAGNLVGSRWEHTGRVELTAGMLRHDWPADIDVVWTGRNESIDDWNIELALDETRLSGSGSFQLDSEGLDLRITELIEHRKSGEKWTLVGPTRLIQRLSEEDDLVEWWLEPVKLTGPEDASIELEGRWADLSDFRLAGEIENISLDEWQPWIGQSKWTTASLGNCAFVVESVMDPEGGYNLTGRGHIQGEWLSPANFICSGKGSWFIENSRMGFGDLSIQVDGMNWFKIDGTIPVSLHGDDKAMAKVVFAREETMEVNINLEPIKEIPPFLADRLPFKVTDLQASLVASGTLANPQAKLSAASEKLSWSSPDAKLVNSVMDLSLSAEIGLDSIRLDSFALRLPESRKPESIGAELNGLDWVRLFEDRRDYPWNDLAWSASIGEWPVAALGAILPQGLQPEGSFSLDLAKERGEDPEGNLDFAGLSWRAVGSGLVAREISGRAHLDGRRLDDLELNASLGGGSARMNGWLDFANWSDPRFSLQVESDQIDIVRRSDLILRGRTQLTAQYLESDSIPLLRGEIELMRSLWLSDLLDFTRQGVTTAAQRPPFFSVSARPFADWRLDISIHGENFLQLQSTLLRGSASAELRLGGSLGEPLLAGNATMDEAALLFPFGTLKSSGLQTWIPEDDPYSIKLAGTGEGVIYGYLVQFVLSGTSELPSIQFNSVPSLAQHEILLMLTTGAIPSSDSTASASERTRRVGLYLGKDYFSGLFGSDGASRLEIRSGEGFSPFRREGEVLEYKIDEKWSILGEYDDFDGYNVDFRRILLQR